MTRSVLFPAAVAFAAFFAIVSGTQAAQTKSDPSYDQVQVDGICAQTSLALWDHADADFHAGDFPRTIALDRIISSAEPHFQEAYATGGWLMESDGDLADAEAYYKQGVANNSDSSYMYYQLGFFYFNTMKNYPVALKTFSQDVKTPDAEDNDWKMLAHSYERVGDIDHAVSTWKVIKQRFPKSPAVDYNLNKDLKLQSAKQSGLPPAAKNTP